MEVACAAAVLLSFLSGECERGGASGDGRVVLPSSSQMHLWLVPTKPLLQCLSEF